jgi:hypothetical protein
MVEWRDWGAYSAGTLGTKPMIVGAKYITLEELVDEVMPLLYRSAHTIIGGQIPVFTEWGVEDLKQNMMLLKNHYSLRHLNYLDDRT